MTENKKHIPKSGTYSAFPENSVNAEAKPPRAKEPVSPIKTAAGETLKSRYASNAPARQKDKIASPSFPLSLQIKMPKKIKNGMLAPAAKPSKPSVKFTAFTVPKNTNTDNGKIQLPIAIDRLRKDNKSPKK